MSGREAALERVRETLEVGGRAWVWGPSAGRTLRAARDAWAGPSVWRSGTLAEVLPAGIVPFVDAVAADCDLPGPCAVASDQPPREGWAGIEVGDEGAVEALLALIAPWYPAGFPPDVRRRAVAQVEACGSTPEALAIAAALWPHATGVVSTGSGREWCALTEADQAVLCAAAAFPGTFHIDDLARLVPVDPHTLARLTAEGWLRSPEPGWSRVAAGVEVQGDRPEAAAAELTLARAERERFLILRRGGSRAELLRLGPALRTLVERGLGGRRALVCLGLAMQDLRWLLDRLDEHQPPDCTIERERARALRVLGDFGGAKAAGERAVALASTAAERAEATLDHARNLVVSGGSDEAIPVIRAALDWTEDPGVRAELWLTLGIAHHGRQELETALAAYGEALAGGEHISPRLAVYGRSNRAHALLGLGRPAEAREILLALVVQEELRQDPHTRGQLLGSLALVELEEGQADRAATLGREAARELRAVPDAAVSFLNGCRLAAAEALRGDERAAAEVLGEAERQVVGLRVDDLHHVAALTRGLLSWLRGQLRDAVDRLAAARASGVVDHLDEARVIAGALERVLRDRVDAVLIGPGGAWLRLPGGERVDLGRMAVAARLVDALAAERERAPGLALDRSALFAAGWPDTHIAPTSAANRLNVALNQLRGLGLRDLLLHVEGGWLLDPAWPVLRLRED